MKDQSKKKGVKSAGSFKKFGSLSAKSEKKSLLKPFSKGSETSTTAPDGPRRKKYDFSGLAATMNVVKSHNDVNIAAADKRKEVGADLAKKDDWKQKGKEIFGANSSDSGPVIGQVKTNFVITDSVAKLAKAAAAASAAAEGQQGQQKDKEKVEVKEGVKEGVREEVKLTKQQRKDRNKNLKRQLEREEAKQSAAKGREGEEKLTKQQRKDRNKNQRQQQQQQGGGGGKSKSSSHANSVIQQNANTAKREGILPAPCPQDLRHKDLERFVVPSDEKYDELLSTCYGDFVTQAPDAFDRSFHTRFRSAMEGLETQKKYQFDYTQPMGINTKVAKTFVSRCLVGDAGITYKYLGLRMFGYPWEEKEKGCTGAMAEVGRLNKELSSRTDHLLAQAGKTHGTGGGSAFNLTLINRCFPDGEVVTLKEEPTFKNGEKCTVSWHADSSLQNYSSIAVYHCANETLADPASEEKAEDEGEGEGEGQGEGVDKQKEGSWRIALRQAHNVEGPNAGKKKFKQSEDAQAAAQASLAPPIAVPLPSEYSYFLLDDFNHHNQHSVLAGTCDRYASTHRVGRTDGHTYASISGKLSSAVGGHGMALKQVRSEQLALTEVEFEWLRQFYVQGKVHCDNHEWWKGPMQELVRLWGVLEDRTQQVLEVLQDAGGRLESDLAALPKRNEDEDEETKRKRKELKKRSKRVEHLDEGVFTEMSSALEDRQTKREGWRARYEDPLLKTAEVEIKPIAVPFPRKPIQLGGLQKRLAEWKQFHMNKQEENA